MSIHPLFFRLVGDSVGFWSDGWFTEVDAAKQAETNSEAMEHRDATFASD